jgi:predicted subunit of tRNA(5-methylaminomethyl-2-thiouridylate) methyltransferase
MDAAVCFSGGKDSALAALLLEPFYDVTLVSATADITDSAAHAREAADAVGFPFERVELDESVVREAAERVVADGFPRNGIQAVHEHALEVIAELEYDAVADGTRRDDRVPTIPRAFAQSLEDRYGIDYLSPLSGFGRSAVDRLVETHLDVETGPSEQIPMADYETEIRAVIATAYGDETVRACFPEHTQTRVRGRQ